MRRLLFYCLCLLFLFGLPASASYYYSAVTGGAGCSYTLKDSQTDDNTANYVGDIGIAAISTTQEAGSSYDVDRVTFLLKKMNSPTGDLYCYMYSTSDGNENPPNTKEATSETVIDASTLTTTSTAYNFDFASPLSETSGTVYQAVLYYDGTLSATHKVHVKGESYVGGDWGVYVNDSAPGDTSDAANWSEDDSNGSLTYYTYDCE